MRDSLNQAVAMAQKIGHVFLATVDGLGNPHICIVQAVNIECQERLKLVAWFCRCVLENLNENSNVSIVIWDHFQDIGYQLCGEVEEMKEIAELDGYAAETEEGKHFPQMEWKVVVRVDKVLTFQKRPQIGAEVQK